MITIAICDDDKTDAKTLEYQVRASEGRLNQELVLYSFLSGEQLLASGVIPDILFLDIVMGEKDGLEVGREMKGRNPDMLIVYTTNLREKIAAALNRIHAYGYLVKPVREEELYAVLSDAVERVAQRRKDAGRDMVHFLSENKAVLRLRAEEIYYFEYCERRVRIVAESGVYLCREKIGGIAERMEQYGFVMSHQSFVVNLYQIQLVKEQFLVMKNGDKVLLAQKRAAGVRKKLFQAAGKLR